MFLGRPGATAEKTGRVHSNVQSSLSLSEQLSNWLCTTHIIRVILYSSRGERILTIRGGRELRNGVPEIVGQRV